MDIGYIIEVAPNCDLHNRIFGEKVWILIVCINQLKITKVLKAILAICFECIGKLSYWQMDRPLFKSCCAVINMLTLGGALMEDDILLIFLQLQRHFRKLRRHNQIKLQHFHSNLQKFIFFTYFFTLSLFIKVLFHKCFIFMMV